MNGPNSCLYPDYMKPHITNLKHQQFSKQIEYSLQKMEEIPDEEKMQVAEKIEELKSNKHALEGIYSSYQLKLKELSNLLDDYERTQHISRIRLRKMQLWLKFTYAKLTKEFF